MTTLNPWAYTMTCYMEAIDYLYGESASELPPRAELQRMAALIGKWVRESTWRRSGRSHANSVSHYVYECRSSANRLARNDVNDVHQEDIENMNFYVDQLKAQLKQYAEAYNTVTDQDIISCLLYTSPSPRDRTRSRMPSAA